MTDEVLDSDVANTPETPAAQNAPDEQDEMLPKSRVEELVKKAKLKGRDSMQAELDAIKAENAALRNQGMGGMPSAPAVNVDEIKQQIYQQIQDEFQKAREAQAATDLDEQAKKIAMEYHTKMKSGSAKYEDFDEIMADFNPQAFPNLVFLANQVDNTPDVMRELVSNPQKWATVTVLSEKDPTAAKKMIASISQSIKANELAKAQEKDVAPPLSRLTSSSTGKDSGRPGLKDFKRMFKG